MLVQRRGEDHEDIPLYGGAGVLGLDRYFRGVSALPTAVMLYHLEPGAEEGEHLHLEGDPASCTTGSSEELYVVVAGEVVMTVDGESATLRAGDAGYAPAGSRHGVVNRTEAPAELVLVFGPAASAADGAAS